MSSALPLSRTALSPLRALRIPLCHSSPVASSLPPSRASLSRTALFSSSTCSHSPSADDTAPKSSVPKGTPLKGLNFFVGKSDPVAMDDSEYPPWVFALADQTKRKDKDWGDEAGSPDGSKPPSRAYLRMQNNRKIVYANAQRGKR
ncbi:hypothetical protein M427DRAFT_53560 [Gonapodya prolifera JEL478]|uniref:Large ribosomal subunit protein mL54 n=1 Tax=Gonapodya prolifera (strain JEL478) TaxID=1344416 RepID=A0A139APB9_GONPJ|nr:hypothetical protein M427DRAFT_53560 [Gonapodya prolifera JEL478]|eukprot:KXS18601.1 hypothetical protein M427DRAFT_53560 [Gonapodya prolifera JEL478]